MKVTLLGGGVFYGPHGVMESHGPNSVIEVDNGDRIAVKFWLDRVESGAADLTEAPPAKPAEAASKTAAARPERAVEEPPPKSGAKPARPGRAGGRQGTS
jgi:hypothetical protein